MRDILGLAISLLPRGSTVEHVLTGVYPATDVLGKQSGVPLRKEGASARGCRRQQLKGGVPKLTPDCTEAKKGGGRSLPGAPNAT